MSSIVCEFVSSGIYYKPITWWLPYSPTYEVHKFIYLDNTWTSIGSQYPNPNSDEFISVFIKCGDGDALILVYCRFPHYTLNKGLDGSVVFMNLLSESGNTISFTWNDIINGTSKTELTLKIIQYKNLDLSIDNTICQKNTDLTLLPVECNWELRPGMITDNWLMDMFYRVWFTEGNVPLDSIDTGEFLARLCYSPCIGATLRQHEPINRFITEFIHDPQTMAEATCIAYHVYLAFIMSETSMDINFTEMQKRAIQLGLPVVGVDKNNFSRLMLIPILSLVDLIPMDGFDEYKFDVTPTSGDIFPLTLQIVDDINDVEGMPFFETSKEKFMFDVAYTCAHTLIYDNSSEFGLSFDVTIDGQFTPRKYIITQDDHWKIKNCAYPQIPLNVMTTTIFNDRKVYPRAEECMLVYGKECDLDEIDRICMDLHEKTGKQHNAVTIQYHTGSVTRLTPIKGFFASLVNI